MPDLKPGYNLIRLPFGTPARPIIRHCERSETIQSAANEEWIASSRSLSSGARSRDPLAPRNDGGKNKG